MTPPPGEDDGARPVRVGAARLWSSSAVRYLVVGVFAYAFDVGLLALIHDALGIAVAVAAPVAFLTSFGVTYLLQRTFAFRSQSSMRASAVKYALLVAFNTVATTGIVALAPVVGLPWIVGKTAAVASTTVWNFFCYRYWIFPERPARPERT